MGGGEKIEIRKPILLYPPSLRSYGGRRCGMVRHDASGGAAADKHGGDVLGVGRSFLGGLGLGRRAGARWVCVHRARGGGSEQGAARFDGSSEAGLLFKPENVALRLTEAITERTRTGDMVPRDTPA